MLVYEYKLRVSSPQQAATREAIRITQFIRNTCLRLWMEGRRVSENDLQLACSRLAHAVATARTPHLSGSPSRCRPRLGSDQSLLRQLPSQTSRQEGLSSLPPPVPLGGVYGYRLAAGS